MNEIDRTGETANHSGRYGGRIRLFVLHTSEGGKLQTPEDLHQWMKNNGVSYHYILGKGIILAIVDTDRASWSALDANGYSINLVYAGSQAAMSRQEWIDRFGADIRNTAEIIVRDARKYGFDPYLIDWGQVGRGEDGTTDHRGITEGLGIGDHTDVGGQYPFDLLRQYIDEFVRGAAPAPAPVPAPNAIAALRAQPGFEWLGDKVTVGVEVPINDDRDGKFVEFANGWIYWTKGTGAVAIPRNIFEEWAVRGYERSPLGYPVNHHTTLPVGGEPVGDVQAFENGALYRKYGQAGVWVHGKILAHYRRSGFENGPLGWPISEEQPVEDGRIQHFENGYITWSPEGTTALRAEDGPDEVLPDRTH